MVFALLLLQFKELTIKKRKVTPASDLPMNIFDKLPNPKEINLKNHLI